MRFCAIKSGKKLFEECRGGTSWTYGIDTFDVALQTAPKTPPKKRMPQIAHSKVEKNLKWKNSEMGIECCQTPK